LGNRLWVACVRTDVRGRAEYGRGDLAESTAIFEASLAVYRELDDPLDAATTLTHLGLVACDRGDRAGAAARFVVALPLWRRPGFRGGLGEWLACVGTLAAFCGAPEQAARYFGASAGLRDNVGSAFSLPERETFDRGAHGARSALGDAGFSAAWSAGQALPLEQTLDEASAFLASVAELPPPVP
jgi:hypothetical protein